MWRRRVLVCALLAGCGGGEQAVVSGLPSARARTLDAGCNGSEFATVQAAIDAADDGDEIQICTGTWLERLVVSGKQLTVAAAPGADVVVDAQGLGTTLTVTGGADLALEAVTLTGGVTSKTGGNLACDGSTLHVASVRIASGSAEDGGGLGAIGCTGTVVGATFEDNVATDEGGGAFVADGGLSFDDCTFVGNAAETGGGLSAAAETSIVGSTFLGNHGEIRGGGAYVDTGVGSISANHVEANTSGDDGAGFYLLGGAAIVEGNTFVGNVAGGDAGGLRVKLGSPTILANTLEFNQAGQWGGGSKISHDDVVMADNTFLGNTADHGGGALLLEESASLLTGDSFVGNTAETGGAVAVQNGWGPVEITDAWFYDNRADGHGGHVHVSMPIETLKLRRVDLVSGTAEQGGALYAVGSEIDLQSTLVWYNYATVAGGGLRLDATTGLVRNVVAWRNEAPHGAALGITNGLALEVVNTAFGKNLASAAIEVRSGSAPVVAYCNFNGNAAETVGMPNPIGVDGNRKGQPGFVAPADGDFTLQPTSALVDAGDPAVSDPDGSCSDVGLYGGPHSPR